MTQTNKHIFYGDAELIDGNSSGRFLTKEQLYELHVHYERLIREEMYEEARALEREGNYPYTWLNYVISVCGKRYGLAEKLSNEFKERGFRIEHFNEAEGIKITKKE